MRRAPLALLLLSACSSPPTLESLGRELVATDDYVARLDLVDRILATGDHAMVPVLCDGLASALERGKRPDPDYTTDAVTPDALGPELWALRVVTGEDFKTDVAAWRTWWSDHGATLVWDGSRRRFHQR